LEGPQRFVNAKMDIVNPGSRFDPVGHAFGHRLLSIRMEPHPFRRALDGNRRGNGDGQNQEAAENGSGSPAVIEDDEGEQGGHDHPAYGPRGSDDGKTESTVTDEPFVDRRGQGMEESGIRPQGHHEHIDEEKSPETLDGGKQDQTASA